MDTSSTNTSTLRQALPYARAAELLERDILRGKYRPGDRLPSLKAMAADMDVHFLTVRKAVQTLASRGLLATSRGARATVRFRPIPVQKVVKIAVVYWEGVTQVHAHHPMLTAYLGGIGRCCRPGEAEVQLLHHRSEAFVEDLGQALLDSHVDGVLHVGFGRYNPAFLARHRIPVVSLSHVPRQSEWETIVRMDIAASLRQLADHLMSLGHRHIACITYGSPARDDMIQSAFFRDLSGEALEASMRRVIRLPNIRRPVPFEQVSRLFDMRPFPTAVVAADEFIVDSLLKECLRRNVRVPDDLSIAAVQELWDQRHGSGITTTFTFEAIQEMARHAADQLLRRIQGQVVENDQRIAPNLVPHGSTAAPRMKPEFNPGDPS